MALESELSKLKGKDSHFISVCYYNQDQYNDFQKTKSVAGVKQTKTNQIWFDFDSHTDLPLTHKDAIKLNHRLLAEGFQEDNIDIFFSGNKGFHIIAKTNDELTPYQVKKIVEKLGNGLVTLDRQIYDFNRILRAPSTRHEKSGLYKTQLPNTKFEEMTIESIQEYAKSIQELHPAIPGDVPKSLFIEEKIEIKPIQLDTTDPLRISEIDFKSMPAGWRAYKWAISQGRFEIGERNKSMMVIASTCRALRYGKVHTEAICRAADKLHCEITGDSPMDDSDFERQVLDVVFSTTWNGGQYSVENDLKLREYCDKHGFKQEKENHLEVTNLKDVNEGFKHFVKNIDLNTIKTGIKKLDDAMPLTVGTHCGIIGSASSGKTSISLEILKNTSMMGVPTVIASLDMHRNRLYEKVLYKVSNDVYGKALSRKELYAKFQSDDDKKLVAEVQKQFGNVYFYDRSSPSVDDLRNFILTVEEQTGVKIKLLMIDYFERIGSEITDATASSLKIANQLQDLLNDLNIAIITLVQPNKFSLAGGPDVPILNYTAIKGSSFLYQSFRSIVSIWRPMFTPRTKHLDRFMEMAILKNDLGELDTFKFNWDGKTGSITDMTEEQEQDYLNAMAEKKTILAPPEPTFGQFRKGTYGQS
jgi:KaiC/GvpD/RAD55 family RecA-like ATPase